MIVTICYFLKSVKSVFILVQCNTSLSKNYVAHSVTVVCVIGWIWEKNKFVCTLWLSVHIKSVVYFSMNLHLTTKPLKHSSNFESVENVQSSNVVKFEFKLVTFLISSSNHSVLGCAVFSVATGVIFGFQNVLYMCCFVLCTTAIHNNVHSY